MDGLDLSILTPEELTALRASVLAGITAIVTSGQSYSMHGRSFTRANLSDLRKFLGEIAVAQKVQGGTVVRVVYSDMSNA